MPQITFGTGTALEPVKIDPDVDTTDPSNLHFVKLKGNRLVTLSIPDTHEVEVPIAKHAELPVVLPSGTRMHPDKKNHLIVTMWPHDEQMKHIMGMAAYHMTGDPDWVEADDPLMQALLAREFNCVEGRPKNWKLG